MNVLQYIRKKLRKYYANLVWPICHFFRWLDAKERNCCASSFFFYRLELTKRYLSVFSFRNFSPCR